MAWEARALRAAVAWQATVIGLHEQLRAEQTARLRAEENAAAIMVQQEQRNEARPHLASMRAVCVRSLARSPTPLTRPRPHCV